VVKNKGEKASGISIERFPKTNIVTRRVAVLVAEGAEGKSAKRVAEKLEEKGAYVEWVGTKLGEVEEGITVTATLTTTSSVLYDAVLVAGGKKSVEKLLNNPFGQDPTEFVYEAYYHAKPIGALEGGRLLLEEAGVPFSKGEGVEELLGVLTLEGDELDKFAEKFENAIRHGRFWYRRKLDGYV